MRRMATETLKELYQFLQNATDSKSLVKKYLTPEVVAKYENVKTKSGGTLAQCVRNAALNPISNCPRSADIECYEVFVDFYGPLIRDYHEFKEGSEIHHGPPCFGDLDNLPFGDCDPTGKFVVSTRIRVGRTVEGFAFAPAITKESRLELEKKIAAALSTLTDVHKGTYYPLDGMSAEVQKQLIDDHFLFKDDDKVLRDAQGYRDWPTGRGIFHNDSKTFLVWVSEEDHIRIISMQMGGNIAEVYRRLISGIQKIEKTLKFAHNDKYGYITCCPSNLGTTMRASVHLRVPKLSADMSRLEAICAQHSLQARGKYGEHTTSPDGVYDISNKRRLGLTELEAASQMARGVAELIKIESSL